MFTACLLFCADETAEERPTVQPDKCVESTAHWCATSGVPWEARRLSLQQFRRWRWQRPRLNDVSSAWRFNLASDCHCVLHGDSCLIMWKYSGLPVQVSRQGEMSSAVYHYAWNTLHYQCSSVVASDKVAAAMWRFIFRRAKTLLCSSWPSSEQAQVMRCCLYAAVGVIMHSSPPIHQIYSD